MNSLRLLSGWPWPVGLALAMTFATMAWWLYRRETRSLSSRNSWLLPLLRTLAIFLLMLTFLEPVIHHRVRQGNPGRITFLLDGSKSMSILDDPQAAVGQPRARFDRAVNLLLRNEQLSIMKLSEEFAVTIRRIDDGRTTILWESSDLQVPELPESPSVWSPASWSNTSALGDAIAESRQSLTTSVANPDSVVSQSVVVLLSDGQNNSGASPLEIASQTAAGHALFTVGFGATAEATDLALQSIDCPPRVFRTDILRGTLHLRDRIGKGKIFYACMTVADEVVWKQKLTAENLTSRQVEFAMPTAPLYELLQKRLPPHVKYAVLPLEISAQVTSDVAYRRNIVDGTSRLDWQVVSAKSDEADGDYGVFERDGKKTTYEDGDAVLPGKKEAKHSKSDDRKKIYGTVVLFGNTGEWEHGAKARMVFEDGTTVDRDLPGSARWVRYRVRYKSRLAYAVVDPDRTNVWDWNHLNDSKVLSSGKGAARTLGTRASVKYSAWTAYLAGLWTQILWAVA